MLDYVVIGGAQAGLSMAYHLKIMEKKFIVLDGEKEVGASWLNRWDSLTLFTPTEYNHLPGLKFETLKGHYPTKFEVANYFKIYVKKFEIPVQLNTLVTSVRKTEKGFYVTHNDGEIEAKNIIVIRVRSERILPAPGCVVGGELLVTCGLSLLLSRSAPHR